MMLVTLVAAAMIRAPDEFPPLGPEPEPEPEAPEWTLAGSFSVWFELTGGDVRKSSANVDEVSLRGELGVGGLAVPIPIRLLYRSGKTAYEFGFWHLAHSGGKHAKRDFVFDGVPVTTGDDLDSELTLGFYKLAYRRILWDSERFRFLIDAGADLVDLDLSVRAPAGKGELDEFVPVVNVGLEMEARVAPEIYVTLRTTGLSWSDLLGFQGDLFSIQGMYRHLDIGVLWRTSLRTYVGASYRFLQIGFDSSDREADMIFQGLSFSARYWW